MTKILQPCGYQHILLDIVGKLFLTILVDLQGTNARAGIALPEDAH